MLFLLILPLAVFTVVGLFVGGIFVSVEIAERRRARRKPRRVFRPILIEGGKGTFVPAEPPKLAPDKAQAISQAIKLIRSAPL